MVETMHGPAATQASGRGSARKKEDCSLCPLLSRPLKMETPPPKKKKLKLKKTLAMLIFTSVVGCPRKTGAIFSRVFQREANEEN